MSEAHATENVRVPLCSLPPTNTYTVSEWDAHAIGLRAHACKVSKIPRARPNEYGLDDKPLLEVTPRDGP